MIKSIKKSSLILMVVFMSLSGLVYSQDAKAGKAVFRTKCGSCHDVALKQKMTGPALEGAVDRWNAIGTYEGKTGEEWMKQWILNWNVPVQAGLPYAVKMKDFDPSAMTVFTGQLTDDDLNNIIAYIKDPAAASSGGGTAVAAAGATDASQDGAAKKSNYTLAIVLALIVLLLTAYLLGRANKGLNLINLTKTDKGDINLTLDKEEDTPFYLKASFKSALLLFTVLCFVFALGRSAIDLGRQQGYQPTQPIKYSHKLHAGTNKIDCKYCHYSAVDGKHANIPSVSTCMNCHKAVSTGPQYGTSEIQKIYDAVGWDKNTQTYSKTPKPVEWVRIHNLPDHVYFNHAQHVNAGKVECQTCHGPIEEMEEVYQYSPLSMGWCINCHRNYDVQFVDNKYYETFKTYHEELKSGKRTRVTVSDIGGTECQKCHY